MAPAPGEVSPAGARLGRINRCLKDVVTTAGFDCKAVDPAAPGSGLMWLERGGTRRDWIVREGARGRCTGRPGMELARSVLLEGRSPARPGFARLRVNVRYALPLSRH